MARKNNRDKRTGTEKKFKIDNLPEGTRKTIFKITLLFLALLIITLWLISLAFTLSSTPDKSNGQDWQNIKQDFERFLNEGGQKFDEIKKKLDELEELIPPQEATTTTSTPILEISEGDLNKLKEKIEQKDIQE